MAPSRKKSLMPKESIGYRVQHARRLQSIDCKASIARHRLQSINCKASIAKHRLQSIEWKHRLQSIDCKSSIANHRLQSIVCKASIAKHQCRIVVWNCVRNLLCNKICEGEHLLSPFTHAAAWAAPSGGPACCRPCSPCRRSPCHPG